jgi:hypothetical protein
VALLLAGAAFAADLKSGLQVGDYPGAFNVTDVTGPSAGQKLCYRCQYGSRPVVSIFTRSVDPNVVKLVKELDAVVVKNSEDKKMAAFVTVLTNDPDALEPQLKKVADEQGIKKTPLTVFENNVGPAKYNIDEKAEVTVIMWVDSDVKVNYALTAGELNAETVSKIVADTGKILN